jgi:gliding motility-associated protein GldC
MKKSEIRIVVELDEDNIPEKILWDAEDRDVKGLSETKSTSLAIWDHQNQNTLRIDLWTKDMPINEMKKFYIDCIGGLSQSILSATGDEFMSNEINNMCEKLVQHVKKEIEQTK